MKKGKLPSYTYPTNRLTCLPDTADVKPPAPLSSSHQPTTPLPLVHPLVPPFRLVPPYPKLNSIHCTTPRIALFPFMIAVVYTARIEKIAVVEATATARPAINWCWLARLLALVAAAVVVIGRHGSRVVVV